MENSIRFILGFLLSFVLIIVAVIVALILSPIVITLGIVLGVFLGAFGLCAVFFSFFAFIWYMSRKEPKTEDKGNYSMDQGKDV